MNRGLSGKILSWVVVLAIDVKLFPRAKTTLLLQLAYGMGYKLVIHK